MEQTPITDRLALNKRYLDDLLLSVLHSYEGQCAIVVGVRPLRATAQAVHSSLGHKDNVLFELDRDYLRRCQVRAKELGA